MEQFDLKDVYDLIDTNFSDITYDKKLMLYSYASFLFIKSGKNKDTIIDIFKYFSLAFSKDIVK